MRKRFLIPLLAVLALPSSINADATNDYFLKLNQSLEQIDKAGKQWKICRKINLGQ